MGVRTVEAKTADPRRHSDPLHSNKPDSSQHAILQLHDLIGNRAVQRLAQSRILQKKLKISQPGDPFEAEADQVAEQVMRMPEPAIQRACSSCAEGSPCAECEEEQGKLVQRKTESAPDAANASVADNFLHNLGPGQPLDSTSRDFFEPRFGYDFSQVRIHTDARAAESAQAVNALAYTVGQNVVFGAGQFAPGTDEGRRLLSHELAHVIQQDHNDSVQISRVPERDKIDSVYVFSTNCGWIDWSHADPSLAADLIKRVQQASDALKSAGTSATPSTGEFTSPAMKSSAAGMVVHAAAMDIRLLRPLSADEVLSVSLSIFKKLSIVFETQQESTDFLRSSSFSQEDLPSNLIGFYMAAKGYTKSSILKYCGALDQAGSLQEYDRNHNWQKNRSFSPIGATGTWPKELSDIDDSKAENLYELLRIAAIQNAVLLQAFCPMYRIEGAIGGTTFTAADNLRVVPTYRTKTAKSWIRGLVWLFLSPTVLIEVNPFSSADEGKLAAHNITWPIFVPESILVCLTSKGNPI